MLHIPVETEQCHIRLISDNRNRIIILLLLLLLLLLDFLD